MQYSVRVVYKGGKNALLGSNLPTYPGSEV